MIVNYTEQGWEIITQRAHGLLAAQIAMHWAVKERPARWMETLLAIAEHDDAETELQTTHVLTAQGGPINFNMKLFDEAHCQRLADFALSKSRYIALLTSIHMVFLYQKEEGTNPLVKPFLQEQRRLQKLWLEQLDIDEVEAHRIYNLLEWCDAFSLLLCRHEVQPEHRTIEVSQGPAQKHYRLQQLEDKRLTIQPWPFQEENFELHIERRLIGQLQFKTADEFKQAFRAARVEEKSWQLTKQKPDGR